MKIKLMLTIAAVMAVAVLTGGCGRQKGPQPVDEDLECILHGPPDITVFVVPLDGISDAEADKLKEDFAVNFADKRWEPYTVETLPHANVPDSCYNARHTRYSAKKVMAFLEDKYAETAKEKAIANCSDKDPIYYYAYYIIGVTNRDIATSIHGSDDYGILGLSYRNNPKIHNSIISTYRLKRKKDLWKLAAHEFCHGFYNAPHCPNDDEHCILRDAKGGNPHFEIKDSLCEHCDNYCLIGD